jgi:hypothetical protein
MRVLGNADFLTVWEDGHRLHPLDRGLLAIRASLSEEEERQAYADPVADWPLGCRNRALAQLRTLYFGSRMQGWMACGQCGEKLEFEVNCRAMAEMPEPTSGEPITFEGRIFRVPTSRDLAAIAGEQDVEQASLRLLQSCEVEPIANDSTSWSADEIQEIATKMALADPLAEIALAFECPVCQNSSEEILDLPTFFWAELESRARRLLLEIHTLATAYGWAESAILTMSDVRRAAYVQMVHA